MPGGRTLVFLLSILLATLALDRLFFSYLIFLPENHSGWDSYRWYNFEWNFRDAESYFRQSTNVEGESKNPENRPPAAAPAESGPLDGEPSRVSFSEVRPVKIVILGSSVARYSMQTEVLQYFLEKRLQRPVRIKLISHAAMMPEDAYHYAPRINAMDPDLVVYPIAMVDLGMEELIPPHIPRPGYDEQAHFEFLHRRVPAQRFYPASFALEHMDRLSPEQIASGLFTGVLAGIRYADQWWDVLEFNRLAESGKPVRSYVYYQGAPLAGGLYREGITSGCVAFPAEYAGDVLTFEIPPHLYKADFRIELEWLKSDASLLKVDPAYLSLWEPHSEEKAMPVDDRAQQGLLFQDPCESAEPVIHRRTYVPDGSGWKKVRLSVKEQKGWIRLRLSHVVWKGESVPVDSGNRKYGEGLRMPGQFGLKQAPVNQVQHRRWFLEDQRLLELTDSEYAEDYLDRIQPMDWEKRPAVIPFNNLRKIRSFLPAMEFQPIYEMRRLKDVRARLNAPLLLILNPENPLEQVVYGDSQYLKDFIAYLEKEHPVFLDLHDAVKMQYFADPHHLTYFGMLHMAPVYADAMESALAERKPETAER